MNEKPRKLSLRQLTLRDVFWIALVCAIAFGWWQDRAQLIERNKEKPTLLRYSDLPDLPRGRLAPEELSASLAVLLGRRVQFGGYLTATLDRPEEVQRIVLREHGAMECPGHRELRLREGVLVELRRVGAFTPTFDRLATFEGVLELRQITVEPGHPWAIFALADAVEVKNR